MRLKALGLTAEQKKTQSTSEENIEADHVIRTEPGKDEEVAVGSNVVIYVSQGIAVDETDVPKFIGMSRRMQRKRRTARTQAGSDRRHPLQRKRALSQSRIRSRAR